MRHIQIAFDQLIFLSLWSLIGSSWLFQSSFRCLSSSCCEYHWLCSKVHESFLLNLLPARQACFSKFQLQWPKLIICLWKKIVDPAFQKLNVGFHYFFQQWSIFLCRFLPKEVWFLFGVALSSLLFLLRECCCIFIECFRLQFCSFLQALEFFILKDRFRFGNF